MIQRDEQGRIVKLEAHVVTRESIMAKLNQLEKQVEPILKHIDLVKKDLADFDKLSDQNSEEI